MPAREDQGTLVLVLPAADGCDLSMSKIPPSSYSLFYKELDEWFPQDFPASLDGGWGGGGGCFFIVQIPVLLSDLLNQNL